MFSGLDQANARLCRQKGEELCLAFWMEFQPRVKFQHSVRILEVLEKIREPRKCGPVHRRQPLRTHEAITNL